MNEPTQPLLYTLTYIFVAGYLIFTLGATCIYFIDQTYIFRVQTFLTWFHDTVYYVEIVKKSWFYSYTISHQNTIIPL